MGAYAIVLVGAVALLGLVAGLWPVTRPYLVLLALLAVVLRVVLRLVRRARDRRAGLASPRLANGARWYRAHPTFGLRPLGDEPRAWPVPDHVLGDDWAALLEAERETHSRVFFTELLWALCRDGARYTLVGPDRRVQRGPVTAAALRRLVAAEPHSLHVTRGRESVLVVTGTWTAANVALTTTQVRQLVRVMTSAGFDVAPDDRAVAE